MSYAAACAKRDAKDLAGAHLAFHALVNTAGADDEERWGALYEAAKISEALGFGERAMEEYRGAFNRRPWRCEPLVALARMHRLRGQLGLAYLYAKEACALPLPVGESVPMEGEAWVWQRFDELAVAAWYCGQLDLGKAAAEALLETHAYPPEHAARIADIGRFYAVGPS